MLETIVVLSALGALAALARYGQDSRGFEPGAGLLPTVPTEPEQPR